MEITRQQALDLLGVWKERNGVVGLHFAARGGTVGSTMLARISEVCASRLVFSNDFSVLRFALYKARFAQGLTSVFSASGVRREIPGLHIWLESGHWLFLCKPCQEWLDECLKSGGAPRIFNPASEPEIEGALTF